jgi:5-methylcytosine-specific restriction endonuclease McrA
MILERDQGICHVCGRPEADQVDHIGDRDNHDPANLAAIHDDPCHRHKTAMQGVATKARIREGRRRPPEPHPGLLLQPQAGSPFPDPDDGRWG